MKHQCRNCGAVHEFERDYACEIAKLKKDLEKQKANFEIVVKQLDVIAKAAERLLGHVMYPSECEEVLNPQYWASKILVAALSYHEERP